MLSGVALSAVLCGVMVKMSKTHKYRSHGDHRNAGQSQHDYDHSTACGYVREAVTTDDSKVNCKLCLRDMAKSHNAELRRAADVL